MNLKCSFLDEDGTLETWEYQGGTFTNTGNWKQQSSGGNKILEWNTDVATTRKQVAANERKPGMQISYKNAEGEWVNEQYVGTLLTDTEWVKDGNWEQIPNQEYLNKLSISINAINANILKVIKNEYEANDVKFQTLWGDVLFGSRGASYIYKNENYKYVKATVNADTSINTSVIGLYNSDIISRETLINKIQSDGNDGKRTVLMKIPESCVTIVICNNGETPYKRDYPSISIFGEEYYELESFNNRIAAIELRNETIDLKDKTDILYLNNEESTTMQFNQMKYSYGSPNGVYKTGTPILLGWISDLHGDSLSMERFSQFCTHYSDYIDGMISTGDQIDVYTDDFSFWDKNIMVVIGNHDIQDNSYMEALSQEEANAKFIAPFSENWGICINNGANYYYKDYKDFGDNVRLIVLDSLFWTELQRKWLTDTLTSAKSDGCTVVVAAHYPGGEMSLFENTAWNTLNRGVTPKYTNSEAAEVIQDFIQNGGSFATWIVGHSHNDFIGILKDYPEQLCVVLGLSHSTTDKLGSITRGTTHNRIKGTKSMDLFNVIGISTARKIVSIMRVGSDVDTFFRKMNGIWGQSENPVGMLR